MRTYLTLACTVMIFWGCCMTDTAYAKASYEEIQSCEEQENTEELELRKYYYNQLNDIEKAIYDNLVNSKESFLNGEEVVFAIHPYTKGDKLGLLYYLKIVRRAIKAYTYDNPEVEIWFDNYQRGYFHGTEYTYMKLTPIENMKEECNVSYEENVRTAINELETTASEFLSTLSGTDAEKLKQIHDWLATQAIYDETLELPNTRTAYGTMIEGRSVCSGFAYAYKYLANLAGLDVLYVTGKAYNEKENEFEPHAWNIVKKDGEYVLVDVTFDLSSRGKPRTEFLFSPIEDGIHYIDTYYFNYPF